MDDDLLPIGRFARLTGLTVGALRHYDELDLLRPARVDPVTGYRSYGRGQLARAREIVRLRELELPLDDVRLVLEADDPADARRILAAHRARIEARTTRLQRMLHTLGHATRSKEPTMPERTAPPAIDPTTRRALAAGLFNRTWELLEAPDRTAAQQDELVHCAHASRYHWGELGPNARLARGEWMCARVYSVLGRAEPALHHARRCLAILDEHAGEPDAGGAEDWDRAAAFEGLARASLVAGDRAAAAGWRAKAEAALGGIADPDDRQVIEQDLASLTV